MSDSQSNLDSRNAGKDWTENELLRLKNHAGGNTPMRLIVREFGRPEEEINAKIAEMGVEVSSGNYNRLGIDFDKR